jgi:DNA-binding NtrC family response regulator
VKESEIKVVVVDDERIVCDRLSDSLGAAGYSVEAFTDPEEALTRLLAEAVDIVLADLKMHGLTGLDILGRVKARWPECEVIIITGYASVDTAIEAMKKGAYDYLPKPFRLAEVKALVGKAAERVRLLSENRRLRQELKSRYAKPILGKSAAMQRVLEMIERVAPVDCNVLIQGETGTGKELVARAIHYSSPRAERPFVSFNCGAFTDELVANELFGHEKGAYTGAAALKVGLLEAAAGGTVFLDEVTEMSLASQVKLLRAVQEKEILRVGGHKPVSLDARFIAATNQDVKKAVAQGRFREDLYYRLNVVSIHMPTLAERSEDIPLLAQHFLERYATAFGKGVKGFSREVLRLLKSYPFPGNVRELENVIERAVALETSQLISEESLPADLREYTVESSRSPGGMARLEEREREHIQRTLELTGGHRGKAAEILGVPRTTLWRKLKKYGLGETEE